MLKSNNPYIQAELIDSVLLIQINRPQKKNALSFAMLKELKRLAKAAKHPKVRAVVLTGSNGVFSAGIDKKDLTNPKKMPWAFYELIKPGQSLFQEACLAWKQLGKPVVAALEGYVWGAGLQLALGADFRVASPSLDLSFKEASLGLLPDMGASVSTLGLLPADRRMELIMSARSVGDKEALQLGLVTQLSDTPLQSALDLAHQLIQTDLSALESIKKVFGTEQPQIYLEKWHQMKLLIKRMGSKS